MRRWHRFALSFLVICVGVVASEAMPSPWGSGVRGATIACGVFLVMLRRPLPRAWLVAATVCLVGVLGILMAGYDLTWAGRGVLAVVVVTVVGVIAIFARRRTRST